MFHLIEDFKVYDNDLQPYSFAHERHSAVENLHGKVENGEYGFNSIGNRILLQTPALSTFRLSMQFGFTVIAEVDPNFTVIFHYDQKTRQGQALRFRYDLSQKLIVQLVSVDKMRITPLSEVQMENVPMVEGERYDLHMEVSDGILKGRIHTLEFSFPVEAGCGHIALERKNYVGQWLIRALSVLSDDALEERVVVPETTVEVPLTDGGDIPYNVTWTVKDIGGKLYMDYKLSGGTVTRKKNREDRPGQYVAEVDAFLDPFLCLKRNGKEGKFYFVRGRMILVDPNIVWDGLKDYWRMPKWPMERRVAVSEGLVGSDTQVIYGYEYFLAKGYFHSGGPSEYIYTMDGKLLYGGQALKETMYVLRSPADKKALSLFPKITYKRELLEEHLRNNHYFSVDEAIHLDLCIRTRLDPASFGVTAQFRDIYDRETLAEFSLSPFVRPWQFGYQEAVFSLDHPPMEEKLYRVRFFVEFGGCPLDTYERVFEVYDTRTDIAPAMASGLPFIFSMPNEQKWLDRNCFDLWSPVESCDIEHYYTCTTDTPIEAQRKEVWNTLKPFKRQWFAWLSSRTTRDWSIENNMGAIMNADYMHHRHDYRSYMHWMEYYQRGDRQRKWMREFLELNPHVAEALSFRLVGQLSDPLQLTQDKVTGETVVFSHENLKEFCDLCYPRWNAFMCKKTREHTVTEDQKIRDLNPNFKRTCYGPYHQYTGGTGSYHNIRAMGEEPDAGLAKVYDGFLIYEDYPFSCSYPTYSGPFCLMTTLLHCPDVTIYLEQYAGNNKKIGSMSCCIDGAVKFANPPMGARDVEYHQISTHAFEHIFNTPYRLPEGYKYWDRYGFHRPNYGQELSDYLVKDWKYVLDFKPARPLKAPAVLAEYTTQEDICSIEIVRDYDNVAFMNRSSDSHGVLYGACREGGLNAPYALGFEALASLEPEECDILFLPTLKGASQENIGQIRRLYAAGVRLAAVSDIDGLEDIFGVVRCQRNVTVDTLLVGEDQEYIYPIETQFYYDPVDAQVLATANGEPVVLRKGNAMLFNAPLLDIGHECYEGFSGVVKKNVSPLMKSSLRRFLRELADPEILGENVGITVFTSEKGETVLMSIDYTPFSNRTKEAKQAVVSVKAPGYRTASADRDVMVVRNAGGDIRELRFQTLPNETVFIVLS